jgi:hypothetical protein
MDERDLEPEEAAARCAIDELRTLGVEPIERGTKVFRLDRDVVHPRAASCKEAADRRVVARRRHELDPALADEDGRGLDTLVDERLAVLEPRPEQRLVRRDRLVEIGDGDAEVMNALHAGDAIRAG